MVNNFSWNNDNFIECFVNNRKAVLHEILAAHSVIIFEKIFSANQLLFYEHLSLVKLHNLLCYMDNLSKKSREVTLGFKSEANYYLFAFLQTVLPFRDAIKNTELLPGQEFDEKFKNNGAFDFFKSLRNYQTHTSVPIFSTTNSYVFSQDKKFVDTSFPHNFLKEIKEFMDNDRRDNFKNGGYDYLKKNIKNSVYVLSGEFYSYLSEILSDIYAIFLEKYGDDIEECELYLKRADEYDTRCWQHIAKQQLHLNIEDKEGTSPVPLRFEAISKRLGGYPRCMEEIQFNAIPQHSDEA
ncbi:MULTISPECIES: hypothetical protein [Desulfovibrio]|uniref:Uncharacterized protein n=1 Tax=Desulfovibrio desulfuricans TaxID=876 RepID=A0AA94L352_DESDE|nr:MULTISPECIES: hypothetical protein [Desulfovibrio]ATD82428.1 hypothetical protein CNY67_14365 [Desulfovibrio sp. G11]SFW66186.1 hypothetical protein SAMN02910291_02369 [Desulfovibrio desulfuricans]SPD35217.1 Hypothetical protein DSVG11_1112 [Desulfovibrio sp. G11]